jgi:hypothetical protein
LLANDTRFMADHPQSVTNTNTHITNIETWRGVWRRTANDINCEDAPKFSCEDAPKYRTPGDKLTFVGGTDYVWGWKDPGSRLLRDTGNHDFPYPVSRIPTMPAPVGHAGVPVAFGTDGVPDGWVPAPTPEHPDIHAWLRQPKLAGGRDVSDTGLRLVESNNMAQDVRENAFPFWAADLPVELETPRFMNAADNGWFLARRQGGAPDSIVGMPVLFEDDAEATGADSFSLSGTSWFPAGGTQNKSWVMVPMGADPTTLNLRSLATEDSPLALESTLLDFGGGNMSVTVTQPLAPLSLKAKAGAKLPDDTPLASGMEVNLGLTLGAAACVSNPLAGYVMKARTVKVNVYKVVKQTPGKPDNPPDLIVTPEGESDFKTQLETFLNGIFKPQINASFQVNVVTTPLTLNWDVNGDEFLNLNANQDEQSDEQLAILAAIPTPAPASNINVFILGTTMPISGDAWGATTVAPRTCWLVGDAVFNTRTLAKLKADIAHEIGHVLVGPGHPDQGGGHASLPGTDHNRRLMCSGGKQAANPGHLLAKVEWEWSEAWFNKEEDAGRLPN